MEAPDLLRAWSIPMGDTRQQGQTPVQDAPAADTTTAPPLTTQRFGNAAAAAPPPPPPPPTPTLTAAANQYGPPAPAAPAAPPAAPAAPVVAAVDPGAEGRRIAASVQESLRSEWSLFGGGKQVDPQAAIRALAGQPPEVLAAARAQYLATTGRSLEADLKSNLTDRDSRAAMGHLWNGMTLADKAAYNGAGQAVADALRSPGPLDLELQRTDPAAYQAQRLATARAAIERTTSMFGDNDAEALEIFSSLSMDERRLLQSQLPGSAAQKGRLAAMAQSEAAGVRARAELAMDGVGTDEDGLSARMKELRGFTDEKASLQASLAGGTLSPTEAAAAQKRIAEIGDVETLNTVQRNADGSVVDSSFLGRVESELSAGEFKAHLDTLGNKRESARQGILNATGGWWGLGTDETAVNESIASLPKEQRQALVADPLIAGRLAADLNTAELETANHFVADDKVKMAESRLQSANGVFAQDEAKALRTILELPPAERAQMASSPLFAQTRAAMDPREQKAFDEALTGQISIETGMAAAAGGSWDGTNEELMTLVSEKKSAAETQQLREGYLLERQGVVPTTDAQREALRKFKSVESTLGAELSTDDQQGQTDTLLGGTTDAERSTTEGRQAAAQIVLARQEDRANNIGGVLFTPFSDKDDTAQTSAINTAAAYHDAMQRTGTVATTDLAQIEARDKVFQTRYEEMVAAQNTAMNAAATTVGVVGSGAALFFSAGLASPLVAAGWSAAAAGTAVTVATGLAVTGATMLTKEAVGGSRYDATGEAGLTDVAGGVIGLGTSAGSAALVSKLAPNLGTVTKAVAENALSTTATSVTSTAMDDRTWEGGLQDVAGRFGTNLATVDNAVSFGAGVVTSVGGAHLEARRAARTAGPAPDPAATTTAPPTPDTTTTTALGEVAQAHADAAEAAQVMAQTPDASGTAAVVSPDQIAAPLAAATALNRVVDATPTTDVAAPPIREASTAPAEIAATPAEVARPVEVAPKPAEVAPPAEGAALPVETAEARTSRIMGELESRLANNEDPHLVDWAIDNLNDLDAIDAVLASHPRNPDVASAGAGPDAAVGPVPAPLPDAYLQMTPDERWGHAARELDAMRKAQGDPALTEALENHLLESNDPDTIMRTLARSGLDSDAVRARVAGDLPPHIVESLSPEAMRQVDLARSAIERNGSRADWEEAQLRLAEAGLNPHHQEQVLGHLQGAVHGEAEIANQPQFLRDPKFLRDAVASQDPAVRQAAVTRALEHFDQPGQGAAVNALRRLDGDIDAQLQLAQDLAIYNSLIERRPGLDVAHGSVESSGQVINDTELLAMARAHNALSENLDGGTMRKFLDPSTAQDTLQMQYSSGNGEKRSMDQVSVRGSVGDAANTEGLTPSQIARNLGLDYKNSQFFNEAGMPDHRAIAFYDTAATTALVNNAPIPMEASLVQRLEAFRGDPDVDRALATMKKSNHRSSEPVTGARRPGFEDLLDPQTLTGGTATGPRGGDLTPAINQERVAAGKTDLAAGDKMKARLPDGGTVELGTYRLRPDQTAYWEPNVDLTAAQLAEVRHLMPPEMVAQQEKTIRGRRDLQRRNQ
jgi:hypothetical protein